jgi:hypothetical protein
MGMPQKKQFDSFFMNEISSQSLIEIPRRSIILCAALNCVSLSIGSSVVHSTLFIIGVMEYWSDGPKGLFEISKLLFQYSNTPTLQYSSLNYFDHIQELES